MIDIKQLRIGNMFWEDYGGYKIVTAIGFNNVGEFPNHVQGRGIGFKASGLFDADKIEPIPITPEVLIACGFEYDTITYYNNTVMLAEKDDGFTCWYKHFGEQTRIIIPIKYLHQLQNLYFCLTGKELVYTTK